MSGPDTPWPFRCALLLLCLLTAACFSAAPAPVLAPAGQPACSPARSIDEAFQCARRDPNSLRALLLAMPKGGDLHHHLTGAIYPEVLIQLASYQGLCLDPSFAFVKCEHSPPLPRQDPDMTLLTADCWACQPAKTCPGNKPIPACARGAG